MKRWRRIVVSGGAGAFVVSAAYLFLIIQIPDIQVLRVAVSVLIDPGWRASQLAYPEGIHAGLGFLVLSFIANLVVYSLIVFVLLSIARTFGARETR